MDFTLANATITHAEREGETEKETKQINRQKERNRKLCASHLVQGFSMLPEREKKTPTTTLIANRNNMHREQKWKRKEKKKKLNNITFSVIP